jgi:hypothetical protein
MIVVMPMAAELANTVGPKKAPEGKAAEQETEESKPLLRAAS